jgi:hypothetical protein
MRYGLPDRHRRAAFHSPNRRDEPPWRSEDDFMAAARRDTRTILRWRRTAANNQKPASINAGAKFSALTIVSGRNRLPVRLTHLAGTAAASSDIPNPTFRERALPPFSNRRSNVSHSCTLIFLSSQKRANVHGGEWLMIGNDAERC